MYCIFRRREWNGLSIKVKTRCYTFSRVPMIQLNIDKLHTEANLKQSRNRLKRGQERIESANHAYRILGTLIGYPLFCLIIECIRRCVSSIPFEWDGGEAGPGDEDDRVVRIECFPPTRRLIPDVYLVVNLFFREKSPNFVFLKIAPLIFHISQIMFLPFWKDQ